MFGAFGLQAVPPTRGGQPKVLSWMFGAPQGLQPSPPAGGGRAKVLFRDTGLQPPPRWFLNPPLSKEVRFGNREVDHKVAAQSRPRVPGATCIQRAHWNVYGIERFNTRPLAPSCQDSKTIQGFALRW